MFWVAWHHLKAADFKTGKMLTEKLWKQNKNKKATFIADISHNLFSFSLTMGMMLLETVFADINVTLFTCWCFCLLYLLPLFFSKAHKRQLLQIGELLSGKCFPDHLTVGIEVESIPCDRSVLTRICFLCQDRVGLTKEQALYVLLKRMVQTNIKRPKDQANVKNVMLMSAKTVSSDIIPVVNWKGNILHDIFVIKVAFSGLYFIFKVSLSISYLF